MIKTKKKIDVASYSEATTELRKLTFSNIRIVTDFDAETKIIQFTESKVIEENVNVVKPVIDADGNPTFNDDGTPVTETIVEDRVERVRNASKVVDFATYNAIASQVLANAPTGLTETQKDKIIAEMGIKLFIAQGGFYKGKLKLTDFV